MKVSLLSLFCTAFIVIGGLIAIGGLIWLIRTASFVSRADRSPGQIIAMEHGGSKWVHPVFTFTDSANHVSTQRSVHSRRFEVGERLTILYDPTDSGHAEIDSFQAVWLPPLTVTGWGLLIGGLSWMMFLLLTSQAGRGKSQKTKVR